MARRFCCCSTGANLCCGDLTPTSGWINGPLGTTTDYYYRVSVPISYSNLYAFSYAIGTEHRAEIDCSIGGGCGSGCSYDITGPSNGFGTTGGYVSRCLGLPCGGGCKNGQTDPDSGDGVPCGDECGGGGTGCVSVCLPFDWETQCCGADGTGGDDCGSRPSVLSLAEVVTNDGAGLANFTVHARQTTTSVDCDCLATDSTCFSNCSAGNPGFLKGEDTSVVPSTWYVTDTEYRDTQWNGGPTTGSPCGSVPNCRPVSVDFFCASDMRTGRPAYRYHTPLGSLTSAPTNGIPFIDLNSYTGAWIATLHVKHYFETQDTLVV